MPTEKPTPAEIALKHAEWCDLYYEWLDDHEQLPEAAEAIRAIVAENENLRRELAELRDECISENHAILTLTGVPREGYTLQQEIRAQLEEAQAELAEERDGRA